MKKMLQMSMVMTLLVMVSPSLFSTCDMKMELMDALCKSLADLAGDRAVAYLEDSEQESLLKMMTKRRCCTPAVNCFNIAPYIPFLPTGPVAPGNYFYAFRDVTADLLVPLLPTAIPFTNVKLSDGHWVLMVQPIL